MVISQTLCSASRKFLLLFDTIPNVLIPIFTSFVRKNELREQTSVHQVHFLLTLYSHCLFILLIKSPLSSCARLLLSFIFLPLIWPTYPCDRVGDLRLGSMYCELMRVTSPEHVSAYTFPLRSVFIDSAHVPFSGLS